MLAGALADECCAAVTIETFTKRIEVGGSSDAEEIQLTASLLRDRVRVSSPGSAIDVLDASDQPDLACRHLRLLLRSDRQPDSVSCPLRDEIVVRAGGGDDRVLIDERLQNSIAADVDGEDGEDLIQGRGLEQDRCVGGMEEPPVPDTIINCGDDLVVEWQAINSPVEENVGEGLRMFPDQLTRDDAVNRRLVRVNAHLPSPEAGRTVYFRSFDVDDPSTDSSIDPNGAIGNDNRTLSAAAAPEGRLTKAAAETDAAGVAATVLDVGESMQPGNNFVVAASTDRDALNSLSTISSRDQIDGVGLTPMLTIWRTLHLELDTMAAPGAANTVSGQVVASKRITGTSRCQITIDQRLGDTDQYEGGTLKLGATTYSVSANDINSQSVVTVSTGQLPCPNVGSKFDLHDDDDDFAIPRQPDTVLMQNSDSAAANHLAKAFMRPVVVPDPTDLVPFIQNVEADEVIGSSFLINSRQDLIEDNSDRYWVSYLLSAFQGPVDADSDPNLEGASVGATYHARYDTSHKDRNASVIFRESLQDGCGQDAYNGSSELHELGHQLGARHQDGGVMGDCDVPTAEFTSASIARIRATRRPGYEDG